MSGFEISFIHLKESIKVRLSFIPVLFKVYFKVPLKRNLKKVSSISDSHMAIM